MNDPKWNERAKDLPNVEGLSLREIGLRWGCSASRAAQILRQLKIGAEKRAKIEKMPTPLTDEWLIEDMPLTARCRESLKNEGIFTVGSVRGKYDSELLRIPNFGRKCLHELRKSIADGLARGAREA